jgi:hypothetical protein
MEDVKIILSGLWVATMLTYLLGDVFRMFSGDFDTMGGMKDVTRTMWIAIAVFMIL